MADLGVLGGGPAGFLAALDLVVELLGGGGLEVELLLEVLALADEVRADSFSVISAISTSQSAASSVDSSTSSRADSALDWHRVAAPSARSMTWVRLMTSPLL